MFLPLLSHWSAVVFVQSTQSTQSTQSINPVIPSSKARNSDAVAEGGHGEHHHGQPNRHSAFFCLFCIHAVRSGAFALRSGLPYVMMMGGTDINVNVHDPRKLDTVRSVLAHARRIIAFTEDMRARAVALLQGEPIPPITVISQVSGREGQSTDFPHTLSHEIRETLRLTPQHRLLLLPSGLRPVASVAPSHR